MPFPSSTNDSSYTVYMLAIWCIRPIKSMITVETNNDNFVKFLVLPTLHCMETVAGNIGDI